MDREKLIELVKRDTDDLLQRWDKQSLTNTIYCMSEDLVFSFDLDYVDSGADDYVQATVYITNMMWNWSWYNVILDVDFNTRYETEQEIVDEIMRIEESAIRMIAYFNSFNK
jgi:hypothetical protein